MSAGADEVRERAASLFGTIEPPSAEELADPGVKLGRALFWDTGLSANGRVACASCHTADDWGSDNRLRSVDARGKQTGRHSQSVFNTQGASAGLRWLADRESGAAQALGSITGSMGFAAREDLLPVLSEHGYADRFAAAFPDDEDPVTPENYALALQRYQETLRTPAAFDRWLAGNDDALGGQARAGLSLFTEIGCAGCHSGALFGGASLQRFGVVEDYRPYTDSDDSDRGLMGKTGKESDRDVFRVQPLRNVAKTAPYFHDGSVAGLQDAIAVMAKVQLGRDLAAEELEQLAAFLETLTGEIPSHYGAPPAN
ncbi:MAG: cytochrome c peroxidase [Woeseiaceae bacterium]|nr:cytochrome c peroxidase [Woeseiaceae bacterium]